MAEAAPNLSPSPAGPPGSCFGAPTPDERIAQMEDSLRCFVHGWLSLLPLAGSLFVIPAVSLFRRLAKQGVSSHPAYYHHLWGLLLASIGYWTNLLWWGLFTIWLGSITNIITYDQLEQGGSFVALLQVLALGSAPAVFGLGCAAARWPSRFGNFFHRYRWWLFGLAAAAYAVLFQIVCLGGSEYGGLRLNFGELPMEAPYWLLAVWLTWLLLGFAWCAWRSAKLPWWLIWFGGAAALTHWVTAL
jgi:hypothetical protein